MQFDSDILLWVGITLLVIYSFVLRHTRERQLASKSQEPKFDPDDSTIDVSKLFRAVEDDTGIPVLTFNQQAINQMLEYSKRWHVATLDLSAVDTSTPSGEIEAAIWQLIITLRGTTLENAVQLDVEYDFASTLSSFTYRQRLFERLSERMSKDKTKLPPIQE